MSRFRNLYGKMYKADTKYHLAQELYYTSFVGVDSDNMHEWCIDCCRRIKIQFDVDITYKNPIQFVDELIDNGIIQEIN